MSSLKRALDKLSHNYKLYRYKLFHAEPYQPRLIEKYYTKRAAPSVFPDKRVIMMIDGRTLHGGMADRLRGCLGVYALCKKRGIPFHINWNYPFDLSLFLEPNSYDWRIDPGKIVYETPESLVLAVFTSGLPFGESAYDRYLLLKNIRSNRHAQYHIYSNTILDRSRWSSLYQELFRPSPLLQEAIDANLKQLGPRYVSFTFRFQQLLGDFKEGNYKILEAGERERLIARCLDELRALIDSVPESFRILVTSDSITFLNRARELPRTYIIPGAVAHMNYREESGVFLKSFVDFYLIMGAEKVHLLQTGEMYNSGFPRFAAEVGRKPFILHRF